MNELGGYRNDLAVALTGLDIEAKAAARRGRVLGGRARTGPSDFASVRTRVVRTDNADPDTQRGGDRAYGGSP